MSDNTYNERVGLEGAASCAALLSYRPVTHREQLPQEAVNQE